MKTFKPSKFGILIISFLMLQNTFAQFGAASKVELPDTYNFDYIYKLKMTHKKGDLNLDYYLNEDGKYFGFDTAELTKGGADTKMFTVLDSELEVTAMFMEMMDKKVVQKTQLKASDFEADIAESDAYDFRQIESKTINGYECEGYLSENEAQKMVFYITDEVPISFSKMFGGNMKNLPKGFDTSIMQKYADKGLMMEMIYEDKKKSKNNITIQCISLEETNFSLDTTAYGSMMGAFGG